MAAWSLENYRQHFRIQDVNIAINAKTIIQKPIIKIISILEALHVFKLIRYIF